MPDISMHDAVEKLAEGLEKANPKDLPEIYGEIFPERPAPTGLVAADVVRILRSGLEAEQIVDLWNVVFPHDRNVWYNEAEERIRYNEELIGQAD